MTPRLAFPRRLAPRLGLLLSLLLLASAFVGGVHRHSGAKPHDPCAVCIVAHAPALAAVAVAAPSGSAPTPETMQCPPEVVVVQVFRPAASSRAPPSA